MDTPLSGPIPAAYLDFRFSPRCWAEARVLQRVSRAQQKKGVTARCAHRSVRLPTGTALPTLTHYTSHSGPHFATSDVGTGDISWDAHQPACDRLKPWPYRDDLALWRSGLLRRQYPLSQAAISASWLKARSLSISPGPADLVPDFPEDPPDRQREKGSAHASRGSQRRVGLILRDEQTRPRLPQCNSPASTALQTETGRWPRAPA